MQINTYLSKKEDIVALQFRVWYLLQHVQTLMYFCGILGLGFQARALLFRFFGCASA
jgi:hypothetical protein